MIWPVASLETLQWIRLSHRKAKNQLLHQIVEVVTVVVPLSASTKMVKVQIRVATTWMLILTAQLSLQRATLTVVSIAITALSSSIVLTVPTLMMRVIQRLSLLCTAQRAVWTLVTITVILVLSISIVVTVPKRMTRVILWLSQLCNVKRVTAIPTLSFCRSTTTKINWLFIIIR